MFKDDLCQDIMHIAQQRDQDFYAYNDGLIQIAKNLIILNDKNLRDFGLPFPNCSQNAIDAILCCTYDASELFLYVDSNISMLVADQKIAFDAIIETVENNNGQLFFCTRLVVQIKLSLLI